MSRRAIVTGGAGFIGSHLVEALLNDQWKVTLVDNFSTGRREFIQGFAKNHNAEIREVDLFTQANLEEIFQGCERVYHLAANADVRFGANSPSRDLEQNTIVTHRVLEASRLSGVKEFVFSSTGSIYGRAKVIPTPEDAPFPIQTSLYGASKLACEGLIQAYSEAFNIRSWIFRFVSILGPRYSHGHVFDFCNQLRNSNNVLQVLGNGLQKKSYLHVSDCISAIKVALEQSTDKVNLYNLGSSDFCEVRESIDWICDELNVSPSKNFGRDSQGWVGDNPFIYLATDRIRGLGWKPKYSIEESVRGTVRYLMANQWIFDTERIK